MQSALPRINILRGFKWTECSAVGLHEPPLTALCVNTYLLKQILSVDLGPVELSSQIWDYFKVKNWTSVGLRSMKLHIFEIFTERRSTICIDQCSGPLFWHIVLCCNIPTCSVRYFYNYLSFTFLKERGIIERLLPFFASMIPSMPVGQLPTCITDKRSDFEETEVEKWRSCWIQTKCCQITKLFLSVKIFGSLFR